jgi:hypothetical protein
MAAFLTEVPPLRRPADCAPPGNSPLCPRKTACSAERWLSRDARRPGFELHRDSTREGRVPPGMACNEPSTLPLNAIGPRPCASPASRLRISWASPSLRFRRARVGTSPASPFTRSTGGAPDAGGSNGFVPRAPGGRRVTSSLRPAVGSSCAGVPRTTDPLKTGGERGLCGVDAFWRHVDEARTGS